MVHEFVTMDVFKTRSQGLWKQLGWLCKPTHSDKGPKQHRSHKPMNRLQRPSCVSHFIMTLNPEVPELGISTPAMERGVRITVPLTGIGFMVRHHGQASE
jgi:hypothetical protein